jgi:transmembrane sensor
MTIDELIKKIQAEDVPWDDVRERRVFNRIRQELERPAARVLPISQKAWAMTGALAALALIGLAVVLWVRPSDGTHLASAQEGLTREPMGSAEPSVMVIGQAGQVELMDGARVAILAQTAHLVQIRQSQGTAEYNIRHQEGREVFVYADEVEIRVVGTSFTVAMGEGRVNVNVRSGVVRVNDGNRLLELQAGESIGVARRGHAIDPSTHREQTDVAETSTEDDAHNEPLRGPVDDAGQGRESISKNRPQAPATATSRRTTDPYSKHSTKELFAQVDLARKNADFDSAARMLEVIVAREDNRSNTLSALFTLGKVERANRRHLRAAQAFSKCYKLSTTGPLAEDALAEAAISWSAANETDRAQKAAQSYMDRYPNGLHAERLRRLLP